MVWSVENMNKLRSGVGEIIFLFRNFFLSLGLPNVTAQTYGDFIIDGAKFADVKEVGYLVRDLNHGIGFGRWRHILYPILGRKLLVVTRRSGNSAPKVVGVEIFYFNQRDLVQNTIHEGFIGVEPSFQGQGISQAMRSHAIEHYRKTSISGISTRISVYNDGSYRSASKLGFRVIERYFDHNMGEERCYLIRHF